MKRFDWSLCSDTRHTARRFFCVIGLIGLVAATVAAGGRQEDETPAPPPGRESMRRLLVVGAGLGASGGVRMDIELPPEYQNQRPPTGAAAQFDTDFSRALISYADVVAGGPPKDGIPSIDHPRFVDQSKAAEWIDDTEPVIVYEHDGDARIYPLQILTWHEIVNDTVGGRSVVVTFCPLCNTSVVFDRTFDGQILEFGVSGRLIFSNMLMYDRSTETWWIQATGRGVAGALAGQQLLLLPSLVVSWRDARRAFPEAAVLSKETGFQRPYGQNPYQNYDSSTQPFLYRGPTVPADEGDLLRRVLAVYHGDESFAVDYELLREQLVVSRVLGGRTVAVLWEPGTASALDAARIADGRDVGTANAFFAEIDGAPIELVKRGGTIVDTATASVWDVTGHAVSGPRSGTRLDPAPSIQHFYFSWRAFHPE